MPIRVSLLRFAALAVVGVAVTACTTPEERLAEIVADSQACEHGDTCVVAGFTDCNCGFAVNADAEDAVNAAADGVSCCDLLGQCIAVDCAAFESVACIDGRCTGTFDDG